jgi:anti-sigma28 factor (negative regulator of flagellin synthesis)
MEISNSSLDGLNSAGLSSNGLGSVLGLAEPSATRVYTQDDQVAGSAETVALEPDWATLSAAGNTVAVSAGQSDEREDKVAAVRTALEAGTYSVAANAVAARAVDAMLGLSA